MVAGAEGGRSRPAHHKCAAGGNRPQLPSHASEKSGEERRGVPGGPEHPCTGARGHQRGQNRAQEGEVSQGSRPQAGGGRLC